MMSFYLNHENVNVFTVLDHTGLPPLNDLILKIELGQKDFTLHQFLTDEQAQFLQKYYHMSYLLCSEKKPKLNQVQASLPPQVTLHQNISLKQVHLFYETWLIKSASGVAREEIKKQKIHLRQFWKYCNKRYIFKIENEIIALLLFQDNYLHPTLKEKVTQIYFLGIQPQFKDKLFRQQLKNYFQMLLFKSENKIIGRIAHSNKPSLFHALKMGRKPISIRFEKKNVQEVFSKSKPPH